MVDLRLPANHSYKQYVFMCESSQHPYQVYTRAVMHTRVSV